MASGEVLVILAGVQQDGHEARLGMQVGECRPDRAWIGHLPPGDSRGRPVMVIRNDASAGRQSDGAQAGCDVPDIPAVNAILCRRSR